jgi:hypothetical protein
MPRVPTPPVADPTSAAFQIDRAKTLEKERAELQGRIGKNREFLRLMDENEALNDEQAEWLDTFYPSKEKGERRSKEDILATRKAKLEAQGKSVAEITADDDDDDDGGDDD